MTLKDAWEPNVYSLGKLQKLNIFFVGGGDGLK